MLNTYTLINAWREMLARIFAGFPAQPNVSPEWLVNPATGRRLKLDLYYPDAAVAVRFVGLTAKGQPRQSDWDVAEEEQRDQTRAELCRRNGVYLCLVDSNEETIPQLDRLTRHLERAAVTAAQGKAPGKNGNVAATRLAAAHARAGQVRALVAKNSDQMLANLADSWRDREAGVVPSPAPISRPAPTPAQKRAIAGLRPGQRVAHERFGPGLVLSLSGQGPDAKIAIRFEDGQERTFLLAYVEDKLRVLA
jgi:hypothetical protein